ncbi:MAG: hypothetical protein RSC31_09050 [Anaerovoracaceae bacterium]
MKHNYDWYSLIQQQEESKENMKEFCVNRNLPYQTFRHHKNNILNEEHSEVLSIVPITCVNDDQMNYIAFDIDNHHLRFPSSNDDTTLERVMKAILAQ